MCTKFIINKSINQVKKMIFIQQSIIINQKMLKPFIQEESDITLESISSMLANANFKPIKSIKIVKLLINGQIADVRKIELQYDEQNQNQNQGFCPKTLFLKYGKKLSSTDYIYNLVNQYSLFKNQVSAYNLLNNNGFNFIPKIYYSYLNPNNYYEFTLIMEDLSVDYKIITQGENVTIAQANHVIKYLAKFHAKFANDDKLFEILESYIKLITFLKPPELKRNKIDEAYVNIINQKFKNNLTELIQILLQIKLSGTQYQNYGLIQNLKRVDINKMVNIHRYCYTKLIQKQEITTLIHWDLKTENIMFQESQLKIIDWQFAAIGNPLIDVCRFLINGLPSTVTQQQFNKIIDLYTQEFKNESKISMSKKFVDQSIIFYLILDIDLVSDLRLMVKSILEFENIQIAFQKNRSLFILFMLIQKIFKFYVNVQVNI